MASSRTKVVPDGLQRVGTRALFVSSGFKGGEGTLLLNSAPHGYWKETILATSGRPLPPLLASIAYLVYVVGVTVVSEVLLPEAASDSTIGIDGITISSVGGCLFFLLVFRSNASYDRWWEGRKKWGMVINRTRDLARQSIGYMGDTEHVDTMVRYIIAFAVTMKRHLRAERELTELSKKRVLTHDQIVEMAPSTCRSSCLRSCPRPSARRSAPACSPTSKRWRSTPT